MPRDSRDNASLTTQCRQHKGPSVLGGPFFNFSSERNKQMRSLLIFILLASVCDGAIVLHPAASSAGQSIFFASGQPDFFVQTYDLTPHTSRSGMAVYDETAGTMRLQDIAFTRPAHSYDFSVSTVRVEIQVEEMSWRLADATRNVATNIGVGAARLTTVPFAMTDFVATGNFAGTYRLTGFNGTVREGSFNFGSAPAQNAPIGRDWNVHGRTGNPLIGPITGLDGAIGVTTQLTPGTTQNNIFDGMLDGIQFRLGYMGQSNEFRLDSRNSPLSVPEPSCVPLLGLLAFVRPRRHSVA